MSFHSQKILEESHPERQEVDSGGQGLGEGWGVRVSWGQSFSLGRWKTPGDGWWGWLHDSVNVLNATELCA